MGRIVLFGATGYTGRLTAKALVESGVQPLLAARDADRLRELAGELGGGLDTAVADVNRPQSLHDLLSAGDVLVTTVGPFSRWGDVAVTAAIERGAHYLDSTGEPAFIRSVFERHDSAARAAGVGLVTAFGYDWVPGNLAGALALREAGAAATRVEIGYFLSGDTKWVASGGTLASSAGAMFEASFAFRGAELVTERGARSVRTFAVDGQRRARISAGGSEHLTLPRLHPQLREVDVGLGWFGPMSRAIQGFSAAMAVAGRVPGARTALSTLIGGGKGSTGGPDEGARERQGSLIVATARDDSGSCLAEVRLEGVNPYTFTGAALAWGARQALNEGITGSGALGPVEAFGIETLEGGVAQAGIQRAGGPAAVAQSPRRVTGAAR